MSTSKAKGLLLAMMEPKPGYEDEFHDWYDTEHLPERRATKGFLAVQRYVCINGWPRFLAVYDLESVDVLHGPDYGAYTGRNLSPWSQRILARVLGEYRVEGVLVHPENAVSVPAGERGQMVVIRFAGVRRGGEAAIVKGLRERFEGLPQVRQLRVFRSHDTGGKEYLGIVELRAPLADLSLDPKAFGRSAGTVKAVNTYVPYSRRGYP